MVDRPLIRLKQGATLALDLLLTDDLGGAIALGALMAAVVVADPYGTLVATLPIAPAAEAGWGTISASTATWPIGLLSAEVQVSGNGVAEISDTFLIALERAVSA